MYVCVCVMEVESYGIHRQASEYVTIALGNTLPRCLWLSEMVSHSTVGVSEKGAMLDSHR